MNVAYGLNYATRVIEVAVLYRRGCKRFLHDFFKNDSVGRLFFAAVLFLVQRLPHARLDGVFVNMSGATPANQTQCFEC